MEHREFSVQFSHGPYFGFLLCPVCVLHLGVRSYFGSPVSTLPASFQFAARVSGLACQCTHCPSSTGAIACLKDSKSEGIATLTEKLGSLLRVSRMQGCAGFVQQHDAACTVFSDVHVSTSKADVSIACAGHPGFLQPARLRARRVREPGLPHRALESV